MAWSEPSRYPYAAVADELRRAGPDIALYTTWAYGIGEPVSFYLERSGAVQALPSDAALLPERCIVLYRPAVTREEAAVRRILDRFDVVGQKEYSSRNSRWGTRAIVLRKRSGPPGA